jgi:putative lipoic acid-binding regulatory protein
MSTSDHRPANPSIPPEQSLIEYPSDFPIKVMGANTEAFVEAIVALTVQHDPGFDAATRLARRPSSSGNYLGLTLTVRATSREQLDNLYRAFSSHPLVKYAL